MPRLIASAQGIKSKKRQRPDSDPGARLTKT